MKKDKLKAALVPLYLEEDVAPALKGSFMPMVDKVAEVLREMADVKVLPVICIADDADTVLKVCGSGDIDCIITLHLAYSPSPLTAEGFARLGKPILILDTTFDRGFDAMSEDFLFKNHGINGVMDFAAVLRSMGVHYGICAGYFMDERFRGKCCYELKIIQAAVAYKKQTIAITGRPFEMMGNLAVDYDVPGEKFGHTVVELDEEEIAGVMRDIKKEDVDQAYALEISAYAFSGDAEALKTNIRQYLAFEKLFSQRGITAYTMNVSGFYRTPVPFYAINNMLKNAVGYAGEGDVFTASLGAPLNILSARATFSEFFCPDWKNNLLILSHVGEADPRFAKTGSLIVLQKKTALDKSIPSYYYKFQAQPMRMTFVTWTKSPDGSLGLLAGSLDCIEYKIFEDFGAPHFVVRPKTELAGFLTRYSKHGGGPHIYVAEGNLMRELAAFAELIGVDFHFLD